MPPAAAAVPVKNLRRVIIVPSIVLVLVLLLVLELFRLWFFSNDRGRGRGRFKTRYQFGEHRSDPQQKLLALFNPFVGANAFRHQRIQTRCAFGYRTSRIIEKLCACLTLTATIAFGCVE